MAENYPYISMPGSTTDPYYYQMNFEHSDFLDFTDWKKDDLELIVSGYPEISQKYDDVNHGGSSSYHEDPNSIAASGDGKSAWESQEITEKVAFKTRSEVEILDDGFKWRKYGKKMVKNSPNPRFIIILNKVAFKTRSEVEILDDGFKWRKYGKKMVKNSPNPRNYYKCSGEGCPVKKRIERDRDDPRDVVTTYEGIHNHQRPSQLQCRN